MVPCGRYPSFSRNSKNDFVFAYCFKQRVLVTIVFGYVMIGWSDALFSGQVDGLTEWWVDGVIDWWMNGWMSGWTDGSCSKMQKTLNGWKLSDGRVWMDGSLIQRPNSPFIITSSYLCRNAYMIRSINQSFNQCIHAFIHPPIHGYPFVYPLSHAVINSPNRPSIYLPIYPSHINLWIIHSSITPSTHSSIHAFTSIHESMKTHVEPTDQWP